MEQREFEKLLDSLPAKLKTSVNYAILLGLLEAGRFSMAFFVGQITLLKALFYAGLLFFVFFSNGLSLINRSKLGYIAILAFSLLPALAILNNVAMLLALIMKGTVFSTPGFTTLGLISCIEVWVVGYLIFNLISLEVRNHVWGEPKVGREPEASSE